MVEATARNKQAYKIGSSDSEGDNYNANSGIYGDAIYETSASYGSTYSWFGDYANFPSAYYPYFERGGYYFHTSQAGEFSFNDNNGNSELSYDTFRPVLCVSSGS